MLETKLREIMNARGLTVRQFAELCGVPFDTMNNILLRRTTDPKVSTVLQISEALNITVNCLMGRCSHTPDERALLNYFRKCGEHGKNILLINARYEAVSAQNREGEEHEIPCLIPKHDDIRKGIINDLCEVKYITTTEPKADTAIKLTTNDLIPFYCKNDIILIQKRFPKPGEHGVFYRGSRTFIRKYEEIDEGRGGYVLKCLHQHDADMIYKRLDSIEYVGTCIDVIRS